MKGLFITFEGCEGSGKSTLTRLVAEYLDKNNIPYITTREPGGTPIAEQIRSIILKAENKALTAEAEALLFAAARAQHVSERIKPALEEGKIVLCDRWLGSSLAYQGWARKLGIEEVTDINDFGIKGFRPDIEFFLDTQPEVGFERIKNRGEKDRMEQEELKFHQDVYNFFVIHSNIEDYVIRLDGNAPAEVNADFVIKELLAKSGISLSEDK